MKDLSIPEKISLEKDIIKGIPKKDVKKLIALALPGVVIGITVWLTASEPVVQFFSMLATMGYLFLCYVITARIEGTPSILNYIELLIRYRREQQQFYYKQGEEILYYVSDHAADGYPAADGASIY